MKILKRLSALMLAMLLLLSFAACGGKSDIFLILALWVPAPTDGMQPWGLPGPDPGAYRRGLPSPGPRGSLLYAQK